jgi:hypothetical protein
MKRSKPYVCSICGDPNWPDGDHNAAPVTSGRCCGICNATRVIPMRIANIAAGRLPQDLGVEQFFIKTAVEQGWNADTQLAVLFAYIRNQGPDSDAAFLDHLRFWIAKEEAGDAA